MPRTHVTGEGIIAALRTTADAIGQTIDWLFSKEGSNEPGAKEPGYLVGGVTLLTLVGAALDIVLKMRSRLGAQGIDPLRLFTGGRLKASDLQERAGFRQKFAAEFHDVTKALNPTTMVIIIDDLDRCRKENVMSTLQLINFLVSSGDCYVLIGIAREQIIAAIRDQFPDNDTAEQYLDKLVNIEIPVPTLGDEERLELLKRALAEQRAQAKRRDVWRDRLRAHLPRLATMALLLAVLAGGLWLGDWMAPPLTSEGTGQPPPTTPASASERPAAAGGSPGNPGSGSAEPVPQEKEEYQFVPGGSPLRSHWPIYVLGILLLLGAGILYELLRRRQVTVVYDSSEFGAALVIWNPVIGVFCDTPRAIKRFMNRLRYIAMRQRSDQKPGASQGGDRIPEPILVALSALDRLESGILQDDGRLAALGGGPETAPETALWAKPVKQAISAQKEEAAKSPPKEGKGEPVWPPTPAHIKRYRQLIASVTAR
jgi:KAP family P-loop domain